MEEIASMGASGNIGPYRNVIPDNTSWIPSIIIWSIAFIWFIGSLIYWFKSRNKPQIKEPKAKNHNLLSVGEFLGYVHAHKCSKCGHGTKVSIFNQISTCDECGNVDNNERK